MAFSFDLGLAISAERYGAISAGPEHRYKNVEGFTSVWIWAEKISDTQYEFYIGYA